MLVHNYLISNKSPIANACIVPVLSQVPSIVSPSLLGITLTTFLHIKQFSSGFHIENGSQFSSGFHIKNGSQ